MIYALDGQTEVISVDIDADGNYAAALPVGAYEVDINRLGVDRGEDLPKKIKILSEQVTRLDIDIDTGIR